MLSKIQVKASTVWSNIPQIVVASINVITSAGEERTSKSDAVDASFYAAHAKQSADHGDYGEAVASFDKAIKLDSQNSLYYQGRGNAFASLRRYDEAIADFTKVKTPTSTFRGRRFTRQNATTMTRSPILPSPPPWIRPKSLMFRAAARSRLCQGVHKPRYCECRKGRLR